jgi:hypothetical protein
MIHDPLVMSSVEAPGVGVMVGIEVGVGVVVGEGIEVGSAVGVAVGFWMEVGVGVGVNVGVPSRLMSFTLPTSTVNDPLFQKRACRLDTGLVVSSLKDPFPTL